MKKITNIMGSLACVIALASPVTSAAQVSIGIKAGTNFAKMNFGPDVSSDEVEFKAISGLNVGIPIEFRFGKVAAMQVELNYLVKGMQMRQTSSYYNGYTYETHTEEMKLKFNYVEVPLLLKVGINKEKFGLNFLLGPSLGYMTKMTISVDELDYSVGMGNEDFMTMVDVGVNAGVEASMAAGAGKFFLDGRYQYARILGEDFDEVSNRGVQVVVGYRLPFSAFRKKA